MRAGNANRSPATVILPALIDPRRPAVGGTAAFVGALDRALRERGVNVLLLDPNGHSASGPARGRELAWTLWRNRGCWSFPPGSLVHVQRPDHALGFLDGPWPVVVTFHGRHQRSWRARWGSAAGWLYKRIERRVCQRADALVFVSQADLEDVIGGASELRAKTHHVPVAVDREFFTPGDRATARRELNLAADTPAVAYVGRLEVEKRVPALIRACEALACELWIAGSGRDEIRCRRQAGERVRFLGALDREGVRRLLRAADVLALASAYEGFPTVILEAWACGRPVVAPPVGEVPTLLAGGGEGSAGATSGGIVAADGSPAAIAAALGEVLAALDLGPGVARVGSSSPLPARVPLGTEEQLRQRTADYTWERLIDRWLHVYAAAGLEHARRAARSHSQRTRGRSRS